MTDLQTLSDEIKTLRDEAKLKMHLASLDIRDEWERLEARAKDFEHKVQLSRTATDVRAAAVKLGHELKAAYDTMRNSV